MNIQIGQVYHHPRYNTQVEIIETFAHCATVRFLGQPDKTDVHSLKGIRTWVLIKDTGERTNV